MKNAKNILVGAMMAMTIATYANANTSAHILTVEEKVKLNVLNKALPASAPVLESPAPQRDKATSDINKHSATQKAAIVGLQLSSSATK
ncbi:hypothetical protein [Dyadobacter bucti]|jgi:hypothetical protein|uniref:hypothetical protein n=1 Tax=Dyadobacter bucti TaxID=2572203 RepID=UPI00110800D9|nr:hypothetical protein [Dyadobacter bucti]